MIPSQSKKKQADLNFIDHKGKKRNRSQYQTDVNIDAWLKNIDTILSSSGIGEKCCKAIRMFAQKPKPLSLDFTPHQLADAAGCSVKTIYRNLQKAIDAGLIVLIQPGDHSQSKAALFRLAENFPTFQDYQTTIEVHKKKIPAIYGDASN